MPSILSKLKAAQCRIDGLLLAPDGTPSFRATNASGDWSAAEQAAVCAALGRTSPLGLSDAAATAEIERWLDATAQSLGYNNFVTAASYAGSSVALWQRQALALAAWRDAVWEAALALRADPARFPTSAAGLIAALPQPNIPTK